MDVSKEVYLTFVVLWKRIPISIHSICKELKITGFLFQWSVHDYTYIMLASIACENPILSCLSPLGAAVPKWLCALRPDKSTGITAHQGIAALLQLLLALDPIGLGPESLCVLHIHLKKCSKEMCILSISVFFTFFRT